MRYLKNNKGSISVIVTVTLLFIVIIVSAAFTINSSIRKAQLKSISSIKDTYAEDLSRKNEIYNEICEGIASIEVAKENSTFFNKNTVLKDQNDNEVTIPRGYKISNDSEIDVNKGIVIEDNDSNQWVWIPVEDIEEIYDASTKTAKLYEFTNEGYKKQENSLLMATEPDVVISKADSTVADNDTNNLSKVLTGEFAQNITIDSYKEQLQHEFDLMINSIQKFNGFYIGRYEITGTTENPTEKPGTQLGMNWYDAYNVCKKLNNNNTSTTAEMMWDCQLQHTLIWLITTKNKTYNQIYDPTTWVTNTTGNTGSIDTLKTNNIYDLIGNYPELGQGAFNSDTDYGRLCFSKNVNELIKPESTSNKASRATMYINE